MNINTSSANTKSMLVSKVVKCKLVNPTHSKLSMLETEWNNYQDFIELEKQGLD